MNSGIINSVTRLHVVGCFYWIINYCMTQIGDSTTKRSKQVEFTFIALTGVMILIRFFETWYISGPVILICAIFIMREGHFAVTRMTYTAVCRYGQWNCTPAGNLLDYKLDIYVREVAAKVRRYARVQVLTKAASKHGVKRVHNFTYSSLQH